MPPADLSGRGHKNSEIWGPPVRQQIWPWKGHRSRSRHGANGMVCHKIMHAKYQCSIINTSEDMSQLKVFLTDGQTETDKWVLMSPAFAKLHCITLIRVLTKMIQHQEYLWWKSEHMYLLSSLFNVTSTWGQDYICGQGQFQCHLKLSLRISSMAKVYFLYFSSNLSFTGDRCSLDQCIKWLPGLAWKIVLFTLPYHYSRHNNFVWLFFDSQRIDFVPLFFDNKTTKCTIHSVSLTKS